jgi:hypothetical protein
LGRTGHGDRVFFARFEGIVGALGGHHQFHLVESGAAVEVATLAGVGHEQVGGSTEHALDDAALHQTIVHPALVFANLVEQVDLLLLEGFTAGEDLVDDAVIEVELTLDVRIGFLDRREEATALSLLAAQLVLAVAVAPGDRVTQDLLQLVALDVGNAGGFLDLLDVAVPAPPDCPCRAR